MAYTGQPQDAEDLRQEALLRAYKGFSRFKEQSHFDTWMYRITVNCCLSWIQKQQRTPWVDTSPEGLPEHTLSTTKDTHPLLDELLDAIQQLNEVDRIIAGLYLEGYAHKEIAQILDMRTNTVSVRMHRIKTQLKERLEATDE